MNRSEMNRRDFTRLTAAAFGGVVAGSIAGCSSEPTGEPEGGATPAGDAASTAGDGATHNVAYLTEEPHVCRGLNTCMGRGAGGENECAGQGTCHTAEEHSCAGQNACQGQGGCGEYPGQNACEGQGECAVPLNDDAWQKARNAFEAVMVDQGNEFGTAPSP